MRHAIYRYCCLGSIGHLFIWFWLALFFIYEVAVLGKEKRSRWMRERGIKQKRFLFDAQRRCLLPFFLMNKKKRNQETVLAQPLTVVDAIISDYIYFALIAYLCRCFYTFLWFIWIDGWSSIVSIAKLTRENPNAFSIDFNMFGTSPKSLSQFGTDRTRRFISKMGRNTQPKYDKRHGKIEQFQIK